MRWDGKAIELKSGSAAFLRSPEAADAEWLLTFVRAAGESDWLLNKLKEYDDFDEAKEKIHLKRTSV